MVNRDVCGTLGLGTMIPGSAPDPQRKNGKAYKTYRLELNGKGKARVARYLAAYGLVTGADAAKPVEAAPVPASETATPEAPTGHSDTQSLGA